jgi:hypothetical protein
MPSARQLAGVGRFAVCTSLKLLLLVKILAVMLSCGIRIAHNLQAGSY